MDTQILMQKAAEFHGHECPGLAIGVLVAKYILEHKNNYSPDEELVAVVENDNCSIDALQVLLGTTYGKGNLIHLDYGKLNYSIYNRKTEKAVKFSLKTGGIKNKKLSRDEYIKQLLKLKPEDLFKIEEIEYHPPELAQIEESIKCEICGDLTMHSKIMLHNGSEICIPCYKKMRE